MIKIGVTSPRIVQSEGYGAVEHYRNLGVYHHLEKVMRKPITVEPLRGFAIKHGNDLDILHIQNPSTEQTLGMIKKAKQMGVKILLDFDDDLTAIPVYNHNYERLKNAGGIAIKAMQLADAVIVSTYALEKKYSKFCDPVRIPNSVYWQRQPVATVEPNVVMLWRGSRSHAVDVIEYQDAMWDVLEASKKVPLLLWTDDTTAVASWVIDYDPITVDENGKQTGKWKRSDPIDVIDYFHQMAHDVRPMVTLVPLHDDDFNQAKSNIAWLETTLAGGVAVVPKWTEWDNDGALKYSNKAEFKQKVMKVLRGEIDVPTYRDRSLTVIERKYNLDKNNLQRWEIVNSLVGK